MRALWTIISFMAVVHLLALGLFVGWLFQSGRLNDARVQTVRELFATTIAEEAAAAGEAEAAVIAERDAAETEARLMATPLTSERQIEFVNRFTEQARQATQQLQEQRLQLARQLAAEREQLERERASFRAEKEAWEQSIAEAQQRAVDEQFAKAVQLLEAVPPKQGKQTIETLVAQGSIDQAVAYLDAMNPRAKSKLFREFKTDVETAMATDLLERMRTFGTVPEDQQDASHDVATPGSASNP